MHVYKVKKSRTYTIVSRTFEVSVLAIDVTHHFPCLCTHAFSTDKASNSFCRTFGTCILEVQQRWAVHGIHTCGSSNCFYSRTICYKSRTGVSAVYSVICALRLHPVA